MGRPGESDRPEKLVFFMVVEPACGPSGGSAHECAVLTLTRDQIVQLDESRGVEVESSDRLSGFFEEPAAYQDLVSLANFLFSSEVPNASSQLLQSASGLPV